MDAAWDDARIATGDAVLSLGTVSLATAPAGDRLAGTIRNAGGDLTIDGTFADRGGVVDAALVAGAHCDRAGGDPAHAAVARRA